MTLFGRICCLSRSLRGHPCGTGLGMANPRRQGQGPADNHASNGAIALTDAACLSYTTAFSGLFAIAA